MSDTSDLGRVSLVWLDDSQLDAEERIANEQLLRVLDPKLTVYDTVPKFLASLRSGSGDPGFVLITSGKLGQQAVLDAHEIERVMSIYVFCFDRETHEKWASKYSKVIVPRETREEVEASIPSR
jgi:hypothetical protein